MDKSLITMKQMVKLLSESTSTDELKDEAHVYILIDAAEEISNPTEKKAALAAAFLTILEARLEPEKTLSRFIDKVFKDLDKGE